MISGNVFSLKYQIELQMTHKNEGHSSATWNIQAHKVYNSRKNVYKHSFNNNDLDVLEFPSKI